MWGCGPVGQFAIQSAYLLGAERVIAIDRFPERLRMAQEKGRASPLNFEEVNVSNALLELTGGRGPDACIDAVGLEAHACGFAGVYDRMKQATFLETDRPHALREAIMAPRDGQSAEDKIVPPPRNMVPGWPSNLSLAVAGGQTILDYPDPTAFHRVAHCLWAIVLGCLGGRLTQALRTTAANQVLP